MTDSNCERGINKTGICGLSRYQVQNKTLCNITRDMGSPSHFIPLIETLHQVVVRIWRDIRLVQSAKGSKTWLHFVSTPFQYLHRKLTRIVRNESYDKFDSFKIAQNSVLEVRYVDDSFHAASGK